MGLTTLSDGFAQLEDGAQSDMNGSWQNSPEVGTQWTRTYARTGVKEDDAVPTSDDLNSKNEHEEGINEVLDEM